MPQRNVRTWMVGERGQFVASSQTSSTRSKSGGKKRKAEPGVFEIVKFSDRYNNAEYQRFMNEEIPQLALELGKWVYRYDSSCAITSVLSTRTVQIRARTSWKWEWACTNEYSPS